MARKSIFDQNVTLNNNVNPGVLSGGSAGAYAQSSKFSEDPANVNDLARLLIPLSRAQFDAVQATIPARSWDIAKKIFVYDSSIQSGYLYFILTQAQEVFQEKAQVVDVIGDDYVTYAFGAAPPTFNYSGVLMNTLQDDWRTAFTLLYLDVIRATQLARRNLAVILSYDNVLVTGSALTLQQVFSSETQRHAMFSFSFLAKNYTVVSRQTLRIVSGSSAEQANQLGSSLVGLVGSTSGGSVKDPAASLQVKADSVRLGSDRPSPTPAAQKTKIEETHAEDVAQNSVNSHPAFTSPPQSVQSE